MWFWFCATSRKIADYPWGVIYPQFGNHCSKGICCAQIAYSCCHKMEFHSSLVWYSERM